MPDIIGMHTGGSPLVVHDQTACAGTACCIHSPSDHVLRDRPLHWRPDRGFMERLCEHGIGHPDHDDVAYQIRRYGTSREGIGVHGCDGCCTALD